MEHSNAASEICKKNYKNNCGNCELRPVCCRRIGPGWEAYEKWLKELNQMAEELKG